MPISAIIIPPHAKKVLSNNSGLVDFAFALVNSIINLPDSFGGDEGGGGGGGGGGVGGGVL